MGLRVNKKLWERVEVLACVPLACVRFCMCVDVWARVHAPPEISLKRLTLIQAGTGRRGSD